MEKLKKESAEEAGFTIEDARAAGWEIHEPSSQVVEEGGQTRVKRGYFHAEKYVPRSGTFERTARKEENELLEDIFAFERVEFLRVQAAGDRSKGEIRLFGLAVMGVAEVFLERVQLVRALLETKDYERRSAQIRADIRANDRRFLNAGRDAQAHGRRVAEYLEAERASPSEDIAAFRRTLESANEKLVAALR